MQSSSSFLTCQRCQRSLQLDDSLSDEALASAASSSSNEGLTHSHYDVISSLVPKNATSTATAKALTASGDSSGPAPAPAPANVKDPQLRAAILEQAQRSSSSSNLPAPPAPNNSLSAGLALHTQLFDLVSSLVPSRPPDTAADTLPRELALGIDHPLCLKCSDYCLEVVRKQIEEVRRERDALKEFNHELERGRTSDREEEEVKRMEAEMEDLQTVMRNAVASLRESEKVRTGLEAEMRQLEMEEQHLESEEAE